MKKSPRYRTLLKILGWTVAGFMGCIVVVVIALLLIIDEQYKEWTTAAAGSATGRVLMIDDGFSVHIGREVGISAKGIRFANAEWGSRADMISAERLDLRVDMVPLIKGVLDFTVELEGADILLEKNEDGKSNWEFGSSGLLPEEKSTSEAGETSMPFFLPIKLYSRNFEISKLAFAYIDKSGGQDIQTDIETLRVNIDGAEVLLALTADYKGAPVELQGSLGRVADYHSNRATTISLTGMLNEATLGVNGSVGPLLNQPNADFVLSVKTETVSTFNPFVGKELPDLGSLKLDAHLKSSAQAFALEAINGALKNEGMTVNATATIADLMTLSGINVTVDAELASLSNLSQLTNAELPETGPWTLNARAAMVDGLGGSTTLSVNIDSEEIKTVIEGTLPDLKVPNTFTAKVSLDAVSLSRLDGLLHTELPDAGPLKVTGNVSAQPGKYRIDELLGILDKADIQGNLAYIAPSKGDSERPKIAGQMKIRNLDITPLLAPGKDDAGGAATEQQESVKKTNTAAGKAEQPGARKLFSSEPFSLGMLQDYNLDFKVDAANFTLRRGFSVDGVIKVTLDQGLLNLGPLNFSSNTGGGGEGLIVFDARKPDAKLDVLIDFNNIVPPKYGGKMDLDIDLEGSGESLAALMGSLSGHFIAVLEDVELEKSRMTQLGSGLLNQINPLDSNTTMLECGIVRFDAIDGMADFTKKIAAQTTEVTWLGSGEINLKTEAMDLGLYPEPRKKLSSLTNVGLADLIHIGGTLAEPKVGFDTKAVAKKYAKYSAYVATGGLSFLAEKMYDSHQANKDQCKRILTEMEKK